jgi:hypothetical protein
MSYLIEAHSGDGNWEQVWPKTEEEQALASEARWACAKFNSLASFNEVFKTLNVERYQKGIRLIYQDATGS